MNYTNETYSPSSPLLAPVDRTILHIRLVGHSHAITLSGLIGQSICNGWSLHGSMFWCQTNAMFYQPMMWVQPEAVAVRPSGYSSLEKEAGPISESEKKYSLSPEFTYHHDRYTAERELAAAKRRAAAESGLAAQESHAQEKLRRLAPL